MMEALPGISVIVIPRKVFRMKTLRKLVAHRKGATAIEYGLIAALIAVAAIAAMQGLGGSLNNTFTTVSNEMKPA
ncbi:pilus assembly protein Flp/PilA [Sphingomonas trueperi]